MPRNWFPAPASEAPRPAPTPGAGDVERGDPPGGGPAVPAGRNRSAAAGRRRTSSFRSTSIRTFAVIPGIRIPSGFDTAMMVV